MKKRKGFFPFVFLPMLAWQLLSCMDPNTEDRPNRLIVLLGSSTAAGVGASQFDSSWAGRFQAQLGSLNPPWRLVNLAVSGYTTYHVMSTGATTLPGRPLPDPAHNITKALGLHPQGIIINLPSNDVAAGFPLAEQQANFEGMASEVSSKGIPIWICTPQPRTSLDSGQREVLVELRDWIQKKFEPRVIDFWTVLAREDGSIDSFFDAGDGIHLNDRGHEALFVRMVQADLVEHIIDRFMLSGINPVYSSSRRKSQINSSEALGGLAARPRDVD